MRWRARVRVRDLLTDEETPEAIERAAKGMIERLPMAPHDRMRKALQMSQEDPDTALLVFNAGMNDIYDSADANRVWLE